MLKAGIVGLPNVGKSTLFNAVTRTRKAEAANYPFCTIDPNVGMVTVPDARLAVLQKIAKTNVDIRDTALTGSFSAADRVFGRVVDGSGALLDPLDDGGPLDGVSVVPSSGSPACPPMQLCAPS